MSLNMYRDAQTMKRNQVFFGMQMCGADKKLCEPTKKSKRKRSAPPSLLRDFLKSHGVEVMLKTFCSDLDKRPLFFRRLYDNQDFEALIEWADKWKALK